MKLALYIPQILLSVVAVFIIVRCFISLFTMRPAGRPKAVLINRMNGKKLAISTYETSLGRGRSCDIQLASNLASRSHAVISRHKDGWFITDTVSKTGTFVNGEEIAEPTKIYHNDVISIGGVEYTFIAPHARRDDEEKEEMSTSEPEGESYVTNLSTGYKYRIHGGQLSIGRSEDNDVVIDDMMVSRHHAVIEHTADGWSVTDIDSKTGVGVNDYKVHGRQAIQDGDKIMINSHNFLFREKKKGGVLRGRR